MKRTYNKIQDEDKRRVVKEFLNTDKTERELMLAH